MNVSVVTSVVLMAAAANVNAAACAEGGVEAVRDQIELAI